MNKEFDFIGVSKNTPERDAVRLGKCNKGKECEECSKLCTMGSGFLTDKDIRTIAKHFGLDEEKFKEKYLEEVEKFNTKLFRPRLVKSDETKPYGQCVFFNEHEKCTVHGIKPLHCKVSTCDPAMGEQLSQWFHANYFVNTSDPESIRQWKVFCDFNPVIPGAKPDELIKSRSKLRKILDYIIFR